MIFFPYWNEREQIKDKIEDTNLQTIISRIWTIFIRKNWQRTTMLKFQMIGKHAPQNDPQGELLLHMILKHYDENKLEVEGILYEKEDLPPGLQYLDDFPKQFAKPKSWYALDFEIWETPLSRVQISCSCRSGQQIPSCCAHSSTILWILFYSMFGDLQKDVLAPAPKDVKIAMSLPNFMPWNNYLKAKAAALEKENPELATWTKDICICNKAFANDDVIECSSCGKWYHPKCIGQEYEKIKEHQRVMDYWHCFFCDHHCKFLSQQNYLSFHR